jgi:WD40 repeat protein/serine/threonine protein kinase
MLAADMADPDPEGSPELPRQPDRTELQPEAARSASGRLSVPQGVERDPNAPDIRGYVLVAPIGSGAYAQVWKAWQSRTHKWVAVKVFTQKSGVNWLFLQREVERLIRLDKHPHVVSLLDADLDGEVPYYVMDYMEGGSLEKFVDPKNTVGAAQAALWLEELASALAYVHAKGLIHCDLKPANILLDEEGHVRLADFGQSRIVTDSSGALGTLFYMAPEQAVVAKEGEPLQPDVRWDVYGLGASLWAILAGRVPHGEAENRDWLAAATSLEGRLNAYREIIETRPLESCRPASSGRADEDLAAIVDQCVAPRAERRYASVRDIADDLAARRESRPVRPLAGRRGYRLKKFFRRNATLAALAAFALAALTGAFAQILRERDAAKRELAAAYVSRAQRAEEDGDWASALLFYTHSYLISPSDLARWNVAASRSELSAPSSAFDDGAKASEGVALAPDRRTVFIAGKEGGRLLDWKTRKILVDRIPYVGALRSVAFSPDGRLVATATQTGEIRLWNAQTGAPVGATMRQPDPAMPSDSGVMIRMFHGVETDSLAVSPDGRTVLIGVYNSQARLWDSSRGVPIGPKMDHNGLNSVAFSPDGKIALTVGYAGAMLWDAATGRPLGDELRQEGQVLAGAFSPDGTKLATGGDDGIQLWDVRTRMRTARWTIGKAVITTVAFSPLADRLLVGTADGRATRWDLRSGRQVGTWMMHTGEVSDAAFSADGKTMTTRGGRRLRAWETDAGGERTFMLGGSYPNVRTAVFTRDGREIVTVDSTPNSVRRWDAATLKPVGEALKPPIPIMASKFVFSPDRSVALLADYGKTARLWDLRDGKFIGVPLALDAPVELGLFSPNGETVLTTAFKGPARLWDARTGRPLSPPLAHAGSVKDAAFSPDSRLILTGSDDKTARFWDARTGAPVGRALPHASGVWAVAYSPDGDYVLTASGQVVQRWSARTFEAAGPPMKSPGAAAMHVAFGPDGKTVLIVGSDSKVRLWDAATGQPRGKALTHDSFIYAAVFSPDGKTVVTGSWDKTARLWDARSGEPLGLPFRHDEGVMFADFSPDGRTVVSGGGNGVVHLWDVSWLGARPSPGLMLKDAEQVTLRRLNARGDVETVPEEP